MGATPVAAGAREERCQRCTALRREVEADDAYVGQRLGQRSDDGREGLLDDERLHRGVTEDIDLLRHGEAPVERHHQRAEARAGIEQHEIIRVVGGEDGDAVAAANAQLRFERTGGVGDALRQARIGQRAPREPDRGLVGCKCSVAVYEAGEVHERFAHSMDCVRRYAKPPDGSIGSGRPRTRLAKVPSPA